MNSPQSANSNAPTGAWPVFVPLLAIGPVLYAAGWWTAWFAEHLPAARTGAAVAMAVGAILLVFVVPWLLCTLALREIAGKRATAGAWSLALNSAALVLVCLLLRHTVGVDRKGFLAAWLTWTAILAVGARGPGRCTAEIRKLWRRWGVGTLIGVAAVTAGIVLCHREHFVQCFNGDGTEFYDLAQSLRHHFLPHWEIETIERFGTFVANPTVINSYWTLALQLLLDEAETTTRLPCWIWWLGIFLASFCLVQEKVSGTFFASTRADRPKEVDAKKVPGAFSAAIPLGLALLLVSVWYTFYVGYYPYMADPANPGVPDALFTLFLLLALSCLREGDCAGWAASIVLASLVFYAGLVMFVIMAAAALAWQPVPRKRFLPVVLITAVGLLGLICGYLVVGWWEGSLSGWWSTLQREIFRKYSTPGPYYSAAGSPWLLSLLFVGYFLLGCGVVPAIGLLRSFRSKDADPDRAWDRTVTTVALVYLLVILASGHKNLHYLGPLLPLPLILFLKQRRGTAPTAPGRWVAPLLAAGSLAVCILLCWPASREPVFTLNRALGAITTFQTDSYEEACRWGRIAAELYDRGTLGWQIGEHTWAGYSQRCAQPAEPRPLVVSDGAAPSVEYEAVFTSSAGVTLYRCDPQGRTGWVAEQRPKTGRQRCPPVFRPIAISPRPRRRSASSASGLD